MANNRQTVKWFDTSSMFLLTCVFLHFSLLTNRSNTYEDCNAIIFLFFVQDHNHHLSRLSKYHNWINRTTHISSSSSSSTSPLQSPCCIRFSISALVAHWLLLWSHVWVWQKYCNQRRKITRQKIYPIFFLFCPFLLFFIVWRSIFIINYIYYYVSAVGRGNACFATSSSSFILPIVHISCTRMKIKPFPTKSTFYSRLGSAAL